MKEAHHPSEQSRGRLRRVRRAVLNLAVAGLASVLSVTVRVPLLVMEPGPAPDLSERTELGAPTYPSKGAFHFTTTQITSVQGATMFEAVVAVFDPQKAVVPRESIYPAGYSHKHTERAQAAQMTQSQDAAAVAALKEVGLPYEADGVLVAQVVRDSDAYSKLHAGDIIVAMDGAPIVRLADMNRALAARRIGQRVGLKVRRGSEEKELSVRMVDSRKGPGKPSLGISARQNHKPPFEVKINNAGIGGPSAGLMLALTIYDLLVPEDLTGGKTIAGTGTIQTVKGRSGAVGEVGAIKQKVESARRIDAQVFLVPRVELDAAREAADPSTHVVGVSTLREAISALRKLSAT